MPKIIPLKEQLKNFENDCFKGDEPRQILQKYNACIEQTKMFVNKSGFSDVVIGVSGGIDSALVTLIAVEAFGKDHVHAMIIPGPYSSQDSINDAKALTKNLEIDTHTIFINSSYETIVDTLDKYLPKQDSDKVLDLTSQNVQARIRMIMIMAASNENNWLMLNTSNKSEVYTGYSTLYGDMAGGFAPIGDVYKCDVYKMCVAKNMQGRRVFERDLDIIPANIIEKAPSAELTNNQTDEASLGIDYASLDAILKEFIDNKKSENEIIFSGYNENDVRLVSSKIKKSEYKRRYEPPCAKI